MKFNESGQGLVEYALILVLVAIVVIPRLTLLGPEQGEVFCRVVRALGPADEDPPADEEPPPEPDPCENAEDPTGDPLLLAEQSGISMSLLDDDEALEKLAVLWEFLEVQQEAIEEANLLFTEALEESHESVVEWDESLSDEIDDLLEATAAGDLLAANAIIAEIASAVGSPPQDVFDAMLLKAEPRAVRACQNLDGAAVPYEPFDVALQAIIQREAEYPGSTGEAIPLMWELWDDVELGNEFITEISDGLCSELDP